MQQLTENFQYDAFISYSRRNQRSLWLVPHIQRVLESYAIPKAFDVELLRERKSRKALVFRDVTSLGVSSDLPQQIKDKLTASRCLIVVCSPEAVMPDSWCPKEITWFLDTHGDTARKRVFFILAEGDPDQILPAGFDPHYLDLRVEPRQSWWWPYGGVFRDGMLRCLAALFGIKMDELKNRDLERRRRQAVWWSIGATTITVVIATLAVFALIQRNQAVEQRDLARDAIDKLTFDVPDKFGRLPGSIPIITPLLEKNLELLSRLQAFDPDVDSPKARRDQAVNFTKIGNIWMLIGDTDRAMPAYLKAENLLLELDKQKTTEQSQRDLALIAAHIGSALLQTGDLEAAQKRHAQAFAIDTALFAQNPQSLELLRALAADNQLLGDDAVRAVRHAEALSFFSQFHLATERLVSRSDAPDDQRLLATALDKLALVYGLLNDQPSALDYAERGAALMRKLAVDPNDVPLRRELLTAWQRLGSLQLKTQLGQALESFGQMVVVAEQIAQDPTNPDARRNYATALRLQADALSAAGSFPAALSTYDKAEQVFNTALVDPNNHTIRLQFVAILEGRALVYERLQQFKPALLERERCIKELEKISISDKDKVVINQLMTAHAQSAKLANLVGEFTYRDSHWQTAGELYRQQYGATFPVDGWKAASRGLLFDISGDAETAVSAYQEDVNLQRQEAEKNPTPATLRSWNMASAKLAGALTSAGHPEQAAAVYADMLASAEAYLKTHDDPAIRGDLVAYAYLKQGELWGQAKQRSEALIAFTKAEETYRPVTQGHANSPTTAFGYVTILRALADALLDQASKTDDPGKQHEQLKNGLYYAQKLLNLDEPLANKALPNLDDTIILADIERIARLSVLDNQPEQTANAWNRAGDLAITLWGKNTSAPARMLLAEHAAMAAEGLREAGQISQAVALMSRVAEGIKASIGGAGDLGDFMGQQQLSLVLGNLSWLHLLNGNPPAALEQGTRAVDLIYDTGVSSTWANIAHAYLFNGRFEQAMAIYSRYQGKTFSDGRRWNDEIGNDFKLLRQLGHSHGDMQKVEKILGIDHAPDKAE